MVPGEFAICIVFYAVRVRFRFLYFFVDTVISLLPTKFG